MDLAKEQAAKPPSWSAAWFNIERATQQRSAGSKYEPVVGLGLKKWPKSVAVADDLTSTSKLGEVPGNLTPKESKLSRVRLKNACIGENVLEPLRTMRVTMVSAQCSIAFGDLSGLWHERRSTIEPLKIYKFKIAQAAAVSPVLMSQLDIWTSSGHGEFIPVSTTEGGVNFR